MNDACDERREVLLTVYEVGFVEGRYGGFEYVVAEVGVDWGRGVFETWEESAEDADDGYDRAGVANADGGVAEEEDGFEDGGSREDEVAHGRAVGVASGVFVLAGEFC